MSADQKPSPIVAAPQSNVVVKQEVEDDDFDAFPVGAIRYTMTELFERMAARKAGTLREEQAAQEPVAQEPVVQAQQDEDHYQDPEEQEDDPNEVDPIVIAPAPPSEAQQLRELANAVLPSLDRFLAEKHEGMGTVSLTTKLTKGPDGKTEVSWTITKTPTKDPQAPAHQESQSSDVVAPHRRRLRVVDSDDEPEEELASEENPVTPTKAAAPSDAVTPSPAKRLRRMNLNTESDSSSDEEEEEELAETEPELSDEDETVSQSQWGDSQADPEWIPDTQDQRENPADFRIPRSAPQDPLDLEY